MAINQSRIFLVALGLALGGIFPSTSALAEAPSVTAVLSNSEAAVGQTVQLQIRITGARGAEAPSKIEVDGLEIHRTGIEQHIEMNNLNLTSSLLYDYTVLPQKPGNFKIPPQTIQAGGTTLSTPELTLHVTGLAQQRQAPPGKGSSSSNIDTSKLTFAELIVPKKTAYVGEVIPAVVRLGFAARLLGLDGPQIAGQGFTMQKLHGSDQPQVETINGKQFVVYTFKTAIAAAHSGKFEIGPVKGTAKLLVPTRSRSSRSRSPFDTFNLDDLFSDPFSGDPFGRSGEKQDVPLTSEAITLEVKPLPPHPPASFSGAIGNFSMSVDANPKNVQVGDPITVTATISGRGNFDRVNAPLLEDEHGWHKYPPSAKFKQDDDVGMSGVKTFEQVLSPNERKQVISPLVFAYFDPAKEQYVTLKNDAIPVRVEGGSAANTAAAPARTDAPAPAAVTATPAPLADKPAPKRQDILYQLTERPAQAESFTPLFARPNFWMAQIVPFLGLLGFVAWKSRQRRLGNREAQRIHALNHESADLMRKLRREDISPPEYYANAARVVKVQTALAKNVEPNVVDAEMVEAAFPLDDDGRDQLHRLFALNDELRYSGAGNGNKTVPSENRRRVLDLIEHLKK